MKERCTPEDVTAAAAWALPFVALDAVLFFWTPPTAPQLIASDPLVQLLEASAAAWMTVPLALLVTLGWATRRGRRVDREAFVRGGRWAAAGFLTATLVALGIYAIFGATLPDFIPPEESAEPGLTLGLAAGLIEEVVFRLVMLPAIYLLCRRWLGILPSVAIASVLVAVSFALSHELGPAGGQWELGYLATRTLFPGLVMSLAFLRISPSFLVTAHLTGHLAINALFVSE